MSLSAPLAPLGAYRQFILWRQDPNPDPNKKPIKKPLNPLTGWVHDPHDPKIWVSYDEARAWQQCHRCDGIAFVFTRNDPFWFVDIDNCLTADGWSNLSQQICALLPGAAVEISQSGTGLHLFGCGTSPDHGSVNKALGIEFYTELRYVALTDNGTIGNAAADLTHALPTLVERYFPVDADAGGDDDNSPNWVDEAAADYCGPHDDDELLAMMLKPRVTVGQILRGKASFVELFDADLDALSRNYPEEEGGSRPWNGNQVDAALAQHLAFWTGRNNERIRRLMLRSKLARPKWSEHRTYLWRTIRRACRLQKDIYIRQVAHVPAAPAEAIKGNPTAGIRWLTGNQQLDYFAGCVYVQDIHRAFVPNGELLKSEQFRVRYGGYTFSLDAANDKTTRNAWEVFTESQAAVFPRADTACFRPELPGGSIIATEGRTMLNTYVPIVTESREGDVTPFTRHIEKLFPLEDDRAIIYAYLAALVQYPGKKFQWCPVIQGAEGNGKTFIASAVTACIGSRYTHLPNAQDLGGNGGKFNSWIERRLLIVIEEITIADRMDILEVLKPLITNERLEVQGKGKDQVTGDNRANFLMFCNDKGSIAVGLDKRRYAPFYTAQQVADDLARDGMDGDYFPKLYDWAKKEGGYAFINHFLRTYEIPAKLNPATKLHRAPITSSTTEMLSLSLGPVEQEIQEAIGEGRTGFCGGWVSSLALDKLLRDTPHGRRYSHRRRNDMMRALGYEQHPHLPDGRVNNVLPSEGGKPRLYVSKNHIALNMKVHTHIVEAYLRAQGVLAPALMGRA